MTKTYKGRTPEEQREYNRKRKENYKRSRETKTPDDESKVDFQMEDVPLSPAPTWKERMLAPFQRDEDEEEQKPSKRDNEQANKSEKLLATTLPMTISGMIALFSRDLFRDPFKPCAPEKKEVAAILLPIFSVIARHVEVEAKVHQDAIDIVSALLASITLGMRMFLTMKEINYATANGQPANISNIRGNSNADQVRAYYGTVRPHPNENYVDDGTNGYGGNGSIDGDNVEFDTGGVVDDRTREANLVAELLRKDTLGRQQMGLAPRVLPSRDGTAN